MKRLILASLLAAAGCGTSTPTSTPDLSMGPSEVTMLPPNATSTKWVVNKLVVPTQPSDYAIDLNGDGHKDNKLGNIIGALSAANLDTQSGIDQSVMAGSVVLLAEFKTTDPMTAPAAGVTLSVGKKTAAPPKFDGSDAVMVDASQKGADFLGTVAGGTFKSNDPVTTANPVQVTLQLPLIAGASPLALKINGAHIQFVVGPTGLTMGEIHGSIKNTDVQGSLIPAVASLLQTKIMMDCPKGPTVTDGMCKADPDCSGGDTCQNVGGAMACSSCKPSARQILSFFDMGMACSNPDGTMSKPMDGKIGLCEVSTNGLIMSVLTPDIQVYDSDGVTYKPNKANTTKDSLSLGLSFTAVKATF